MDLTPARRRELKARAHLLEPVVRIGDKGLSPAVLKEIDVNLKSHELIKIRVAGDDRAVREDFLRQLCEALAATAVQHIGKILVVYRENPESAAEAAAPEGATSARDGAAPRSTRAASKRPRAPATASRAESKAPVAAAPAARARAKPARPDTEPRARTSTPRPGADAQRKRPGTSAARPAAAGRAAKPARTPAGKSRSAGRTR